MWVMREAFILSSRKVVKDGAVRSRTHEASTACAGGTVWPLHATREGTAHAMGARESERIRLSAASRTEPLIPHDEKLTKGSGGWVFARRGQGVDPTWRQVAAAALLYIAVLYMFVMILNPPTHPSAHHHCYHHTTTFCSFTAINDHINNGGHR